MYNAAIISKRYGIVAIINTDMPNGDVRFAYETLTDNISGRENLLNAQWGKITRSRRVLESREFQECLSFARLVSSDGICPEFLIME